MTYINYENDLPKHYVRRYGWLEAAKQQKRAIRTRSMRYFTFCAAGAIDVFMLERAEILKRSATTEWLEGVYFCEKNEEDFGRIADFIGSPEQGFQGDFADIVLFEDDGLEGKQLEDDILYSRETRKRLRVKDAHNRLRQAFPFDIINLDVCGNMFPPRKRIIERLLRSILQILKWQTDDRFECERFTLFLTVRIDAEHTNQNAIAQLKSRVADNMTNVKFQEAFSTRYGHNDVNELVHQNFAEFLCVAFPKFMIHHALFELGWKVACGPTYLYNRNYSRDENQQYQIMHTVSVYERILKRPDMRSEDQYIQAVTQLINNPVKWVDKVLTPDLEKELVEDLDQIKVWREKHQ